MGEIIRLKPYKYMAEKIQNLENINIETPKIEATHFEEIPAPKHVAADASRNSYQLESATIFGMRAVAIGSYGEYFAEHIDIVPVPHATEIFMRLIMEALEHRILARYIMDNDPNFILLDGSIMTPTGIILQYPYSKQDFKKEYLEHKNTYDRYFQLFEKVLDDTFDNLETKLVVGLYNLQFEEFNDEYNDVKNIHKKVVDTLMLKRIYPEVYNFIQALAYYEYMYETNRLYNEVFKREHAAITKTNVASYITEEFLDKFVARKIFEDYNNYPAMIPFEIKYNEETKPAAPEYFGPLKRFPTVMKVFYEPPKMAYFSMDKTSNVYSIETYNNLEKILGYVAYLSPSPTYYPQALEFAHRKSVIDSKQMEDDIAVIKHKSLSLSLEYHVRRPLTPRKSINLSTEKQSSTQNRH